MNTVFIVLAALALLAALWLLRLRGKRKKDGFFGLAEYCYAHRGLYGGDVPENSLAAFRRAVQAGYGAELDVQLSKDGQLVILHDETLLRTTGDPRKLCDCTLDELRQLRLEGSEEPIPLFEEVLPLFAGKAPLVIELKPVRGNHAALTEAVCRLLDRYPTLQFCIESFDPRVLLWLRRHRPEIVRGQLSCDFTKGRSGLSAFSALLLTDLSANFLTVPHFIAYRFSDRNRLSVRVCKALWGVQEFSWTIQTLNEAKIAANDGAILIFEHCLPKNEKDGNKKMYDKLTKKDIALMQAELEDLQRNRRPKIIEEVKRAREFGDLSENYEYKAAKQAQRRLDSRVRYLQNMIKTAHLVDEDAGGDDTVKLYDKVTVFLPEDDETMVLQVVSTVRIDPESGFISMESPMGKALLGAKLGQTRTVHVNETYSYEIVIRLIERAEDDGSAPLMQY